MKNNPVLLLPVLLLCTLAVRADGTPPPRAAFSLTPAQRERLDRALENDHANYDPAARMLREPLKSPGYHTTLKTGTVHGTRSALTYAVALLDTGDEKHLQRACDILRTVIALQDTNPASSTYGIWSWFLEEPLAKMSPPDWNWADFCGVQLLQVALDHRPRLPPDLAKQVDEAIRHAARSIERRNVGPGYTNIALMGAYVTLVASELYGWDDLRKYATGRLRRFYDYTKDQGSFTEYNSPTYSMVALAELGRMRLHVRDAGARPLIEELYRLAWEDIAAHFHAPTRQWAGPHSRCYSTLLKGQTLDGLQQATGGRAKFQADDPDIVGQRLPLPCPDDLVHCFVEAGDPREVVRTYLKGDPPVIGTTWLEPAFTLGSVNRGEFWNQRRALLAYWGKAGKPSYLHARFLRDDYDFATVQFFSAQKRGDVLAAINFATDGGNTHISLDRIRGGTFRAKSLRLRFEFGGAAAAQRPAAPAKLVEPALVRFGDVGIALAVPFCTFGEFIPRWESGRSPDRSWLDVVLNDGPEREFRLGEMDAAAIGIALRMTTGDATAPEVMHEVADGRLQLAWDRLKLSVPVRPSTVGAQQRAVKF